MEYIHTCVHYGIRTLTRKRGIFVVTRIKYASTHVCKKMYIFDSYTVKTKQQQKCGGAIFFFS